MTRWKYPIKESKRAPRSLKCSSCGRTIEQGRIYTKTNWGRYYDSCANRIPSQQAMAKNLEERRSS